jgi:O-antigen/teichoic acid export membrane protein
MQLGAIIILSVKGPLSVVTIYLAIGAANAVVAVTWLVLSRNEFTIRRKRVLPSIRQHVSFGSWGLASRIVSHLNSNILLLWLMAFVLGNTATGILAACVTIVGIANPFIIGVAQLLGPRIAQALVDRGLGEVLKVARKATIVIGLSLGGFCCGAFLFGENALRFFYGDLYGGHSSIITVLSISVLAATISLPAACGLLAFERPDVNLWSSVAGLLLTMAVASALVLPMGLLGVVCGLLCGDIGSSTVRWVYFFSLSKKNRHPKVKP